MTSVETAPMINQEIKGNLAKLLATENLVVEHKKVPTACFDTERRVLTLPIWNKASASVYDMLVGHEVGHALYTPDLDWRKAVRNKVPKDFVNVVEDARVEKLMKRKYPGLSRSFYNGYKELNDDDFFCVKDEDLSTLSFIDRINLHFKVGAFAMIPFAEDELPFVTAVADAETFDEVLTICQDLVDFLKYREELQNNPNDLANPNNTAQQKGDGDSGNTEGNFGEESDEESDGEASEGEGDESDGNSEKSDDIKGNSSTQSEGTEGEQGDDKDSSTVSGRAGSGPNEQQSKTQRSFDHNSENLTDYSAKIGFTSYVEIPKIKLENTIVDCKKLHEYISTYWVNQSKDRKKYWGSIFDTVDSDYAKYKASAQKEVNYLVKEFECRKSADAYARASTSRTGVLDTAKLHTYKYNDDIFKKVAVIPDGKNHGLIFILDWSGSMSNVILDTVKQLLNLCWFCKKVQIPFEVYAFTYEWKPTLTDCYVSGHLPKTDPKVGEFDIHRMFYLMNFLSSRSTTAEFEQQAKNIFRLSYYFSKNVSYTLPVGMELSGTPLNESIISLYEIIPQFRDSNKLQKVNVVILTDGEGNNLNYHVESSYRPNNMGTHTVGLSTALRDRKTGNVYRNFNWDYKDSLTAILLENLKNRFPEVNLIGFRVISGAEFNRFYRNLMGIVDRYDLPDDVAKVWKKEKSYEINPVGYDALYAISSTALSTEATLNVSQDASTKEIGKAFKDVLRKKSSNKKILTSFAELVS